MNVTADALTPAWCISRDGHFIGRGGWIDGADQRMRIRHEQTIVTHEHLANLPIVTSDGRHDPAERRGQPGPRSPAADR